MTAPADPHRPYFDAIYAAVLKHLREQGREDTELADRCAQVAFARHVYRFTKAMTADLLGISERSVERARALVKAALRDLESDMTSEGGSARVRAVGTTSGTRSRDPGCPPVPVSA